MVVTQLSFRGFSVTDNTGPTDAQLPQSALRNVLTAALVALTDEAATPGTVLLEAEFAQGVLSHPYRAEGTPDSSFTRAGGREARPTACWSGVTCKPWPRRSPCAWRAWATG
jgi:hypothetical protein